jgi:GDPmannose 4,6-dehydratase
VISEKMKRALITGLTGQDGAYLAEFLLKKGYKVSGTYRRLSTPNFWRLHYLGILDKIELIPADIIDARSISDALKKSNPDEVYHLAAQSFVDVSFSQPLYTGNMTGFGPVRIIEEIKKFNPKIKIYQASSSEMFGADKEKTKNEMSRFKPASPYGAAKLYAYWMTDIYRKAYDMFLCNGILFNHESPTRGLEFVTRRISNGVAKISLGIINHLEIGDMSPKRDWGYAPEYVEGMWKMLQMKNPDDYILATNETHSVRELVIEACRVAGISNKKIRSLKSRFRPYEVLHLKGDYKKAEKKLNWKPKIKFKKLIKIMVEEDIQRWQMWLKGEHFPWDAGMAGENSIFKKSIK